MVALAARLLVLFFLNFAPSPLNLVVCHQAHTVHRPNPLIVDVAKMLRRVFLHPTYEAKFAVESYLLQTKCAFLFATTVCPIIITLAILDAQVSPNFQDNVKRLAVGIWKCGSCGKVHPACLFFFLTTQHSSARNCVHSICCRLLLEVLGRQLPPLPPLCAAPSAVLRSRVLSPKE